MAKGRYKKWLEPENLILLQGWKHNGLTDEEVAKNIGINVRTLDKWKVRYGQIGQALKVGHDQANYAVESKLFKKASEGNTTAMIFWLKNNWRDKYNDSELSAEERRLVVARTKKMEADARISEAKAQAMEKVARASNAKLDLLLDKLVEEVQDDDGSEHSNEETD